MSAEMTQKMQEHISRLPLSDTPRLRSVLNPEYTRRHIALSLTPANLLVALHRAREARELAVSYRNFRVGASTLAMKIRMTSAEESQPAEIQFLNGSNIKPDPGESSINIHAEQQALQKARDRGFNVVSMLVVVGDNQPDQQSGHETATLHPCGLCRDAIHQDDLIDNSSTLIASAMPDFRTIEVYNVNSLRDFHDGVPGANVTRFDFPDLQLFEPFVPGDEPVHFQDDERTLEEERIWNASVGRYLSQRRLALLSRLPGELPSEA